MTTIQGRFPTVAEAKAAQTAPLHESYWWFEGWNFNRPVIACVNIGAHVKEGAYVHVQLFDHAHMPVQGYRERDFRGIPMKFVGPIPCPL